MFLRQLRRSCITASVNIESWNYHYLRSTRFLSPLSLALPQLPLYFTRFSTLAEGRVRHQKHSGVQLDTSEHEDILKLTGRIEVSPSQHQPENKSPQQITSLSLPLYRGSETQSFQVRHLHQMPYVSAFHTQTRCHGSGKCEYYDYCSLKSFHQIRVNMIGY